MITLRPPAAGEVYYRGHGVDQPGGGRLVTVERDGEVLGVLRHVVRHSPSGMSWSFAGSGPADLALSLLADALGAQARCGTCGGRSHVVISVADGGGELVEPYDAGRRGAARPAVEVGRCWDCDDGLVRLPYQALKFEVVARLPEQGWVLSRGQLLDWVAGRPGERD